MLAVAYHFYGVSYEEKIPLKSKKPTILERVRDSWVEYSHAIYVTVVLGTAFFASAPEKADWAHKISLIAIACYFVVLLGFLFWFTHTYSRKARYAESLRLIHSAIHDVRDIAGYLERCYRRKDTFSRIVVHGALQGCLDAVARAFAMVTGANCRVCIKVVGGDSSTNAFVTTACRDKISHEDCREKDRHERADHLIAENTDFSYLVHGKKTFYLNGDIAGTTGYLNTSTPAYAGRLPYKSVIVLPIRRTYNISSNIESPPPPTVVGFLCIDSHSRFSFTEKYDVQMGAVVADALCPILELWDRMERISRRKIR